PGLGCMPAADIQTFQPFPSEGRLRNNLGLPLPILTARLRQLNDRGYSYVVRTVKWDHDTATFEQQGSAPNFQGDVLTLFNVKQHMRASQAAGDWQGVWLAGFTSRAIYNGKHWLFYLARIETAHESHAALWTSMTPVSRRAKAAPVNYLGDLFKPKIPLPIADSRFSP